MRGDLTLFQPPTKSSLPLCCSVRHFVPWNFISTMREDGYKSEVVQSYVTLCDPMDCSLPGSSIHGIFQTRVLEWVAISFSRGSSRPRDQTQVSLIAGRHSEELPNCFQSNCIILHFYQQNICFIFSTSSPTFVIVYLSYYSHLGVWEVLSHCSFDFRFPNS